MYKPTALTPGAAVPELSLPLAGGGTWPADHQSGSNFNLVVFYRGYHCPKCREQLQELQAHKAKFAELGVSIIAISMDPEDRANKSQAEWDLGETALAYGLSLEQAKQWGLHLSSSRGMTSTGVEELKQFNEPGTFLVRADGTLYASWVQTVPFARPHAQDLIGMIGFVLDKDYPPRGTLTAA